MWDNHTAENRSRFIELLDRVKICSLVSAVRALQASLFPLNPFPTFALPLPSQPILWLIIVSVVYVSIWVVPMSTLVYKYANVSLAALRSVRCDVGVPKLIQIVSLPCGNRYRAISTYGADKRVQ